MQLNALKTELLWFGSRANLCKLSSVGLSLSVGDDVIQPVTVVLDLGVHLDAELTMKQHISRIVSSCFFQLRRERQARRSAGEEVTKRLVTALVLSRLDYCNAALAGLPVRLLDRCSVYRMLLLVSLLMVSQGIISLLFSCVCTGCP